MENVNKLERLTRDSLNRGAVGFALYLVWENADILCPAFEMRCIEN